MAGLDSTDAMQAFVDEYRLSFPQVVSEDATLWPRFDVALQGSWYFLNDNGNGQVVPSDLTGDQLADALDQLLAQ
jgi:hypothetical protein